MNSREQSKMIAGCYCRLSDDDAHDGTSISIETQMKILGDYCRDNGINVHSYYRDDGFTGTNFNRPSFRQMMRDAEAGAINTIVVKDLSRFGRNYVQVGTYLSDILPAMKIRFIAIGDNVDSASNNLDYDLMVPIKNIFNEHYPAECSRKTRQAFIAKAQSGEFIGSQAPYGYRKSRSDKHVLEIDEATAPVVLEIFQMAAYKGYGYNKIARVLTERKVITPAAYQAQQAGREYPKDPYEWNLTTVWKMFENQTYLGHLVSGKRRKASFKSKRIVKQDEDQWIVVKDMFPALVSEQLWNDAQNRLNSRKRESKSGFVNIFAGLLKCEHCGYALCISNVKEGANYFVCNTYSKKGKAYCTSHYTLYDELYAAVLADIRQVVAGIHYNKEEFVQKILAKLGSKDDSGTKRIEQEIRLLETRITELSSKFDRLYDDRLEGILSDRKFKELSAKCEAEQDEAETQLAELRIKLTQQDETIQDVQNFINLADTYREITELDTDLLNHLVSKIVVGERVKDGADVVQKITVHYKFIGAL